MTARRFRSGTPGYPGPCAADVPVGAVLVAAGPEGGGTSANGRERSSCEVPDEVARLADRAVAQARVLLRAAQRRAENAVLRELAALDRFAAAADLERARLDRLRADTDREALTAQLELLQARTPR